MYARPDKFHMYTYMMMMTCYMGGKGDLDMESSLYHHHLLFLLFSQTLSIRYLLKKREYIVKNRQSDPRKRTRVFKRPYP